MNLWAYITAPRPDGLGVPDAEWDDITPREYYAMSDVQQSATRRWAVDTAAYHNANFVTDGVPWTAEDFMSGGNRAERQQEKQRSDVQTNMLTRQLNQVKKRKPGEPIPDGLPIWARDDFMPQPKTSPWEAGVPSHVSKVQSPATRIGRAAFIPPEFKPHSVPLFEGEDA